MAKKKAAKKSAKKSKSVKKKLVKTAKRKYTKKSPFWGFLKLAKQKAKTAKTRKK